MKRTKLYTRAAKRRAGNRHGFTLVETLLTVIILSIITVAVTAGALAARNVYQKVRQKADAQTLMATVVSAMSADLRTAHEIEQDNDGAWTFLSGNRGYRMKYINDQDRHEIQIVSVSAKSSIPLVTEQTQTLGLYAQIQEALAWNSEQNYFTVRLAVINSGTDKKIEEQLVKIRPLSIDWE